MKQPDRRLILAVALITQGVVIGMTIGSYSLFLEALEREFQAQRWQVALAPGLMMAALALSGVLMGSFVDRGRIRRVMLWAGVLLFVSLLAASQATQLWMLALLAMAAGFTIPLLGPLVGISLVSRYFVEDRGRAIGLVSIGGPLGTGLFAGIAGFTMVAWDWRITYLIFGAITACVVLPSVWFCIPEDVPVAQVPEGASEAAPDFSDLLRSRIFLCMAAAFAIGGGAGTAWATHMAAFLSDSGFLPSGTTSLVAVQAWLGVPGTICFGMLADRFPPIRLLGGLLVAVASVFLVYSLAVPMPGIVSATLVFGFCYGGVIPLYSMMLTNRFGVGSLGRMMGLSNLAMLPVTIAATVTSGAIHDAHGNYENALYVLMAGLGVAVVSLIAAGRAARAHATRMAS